jgi:hypothetical protein
MQRFFSFAAIAALLLAVHTASAQVKTFDFQDGTDQGWGGGFGSQGGADKTFPTVVDLAPGDGTLYMSVARTGAFQEGAYQTGDTSDAFYQAMQAAAAAPGAYDISYDWYVDTSLAAANPGTFLQVGTYVNTGSGYYAQDFGAVKEVELTGAQLASGQIFAGHVDVNFAAVGFSMPPADTFFRLGIILNGNGANLVDFDNISIHPIPEPASIALLALGLPALAIRRRRA